MTRSSSHYFILQSWLVVCVAYYFVLLLLLLILMVRYQYFLLFHATETTVKQIEDAFKEFTAREDIAIVLISQYVSEPSHTHAYICVLMHC